jgi:ankyrin repeat protein
LLCLAVDECDEELIKRTIDKGVDVNFKCNASDEGEIGDDVIINAAFCKENAVRLTELLLSKGANINGADEDNSSFLSYAIMADNIKLVEFIMTKGPDLFQKDINRNMGCLPIHSVKSLKMLQLLIEKGIEINQSCDNGRNLLHFAAKDNLKEVAKFLVEKKLVDTNQKDNNGETPLDYAKRFNNPEISRIIQNRK